MHTHITPDSCRALRRNRSHEYDAEGLCFVRDQSIRIPMCYTDATPPCVTISAGVAACAGASLSAQDPLRRADEAPCRVREEGRDRVRASA